MLAEITQELTVETATVYNDLSDEMQEYETFIVDKLLSSTMGILSSTAIDEKDATYQAWNDGTISLQFCPVCGIHLVCQAVVVVAEMR